MAVDMDGDVEECIEEDVKDADEWMPEKDQIQNYRRKVAKWNESLNKDEPSTALDTQIGGDHYKDMPIQPIEFCMANNLNPCQTYAVKYICRYPNKNGKEDILKAIHTLQLLLDMEYPDE